MERRTVIAVLAGGVPPALVLAAIASLGFWLGGSGSGFTLHGLPESTVHNYRYAEANPDLFSGIPCYCGCFALGHENLLDCFVRPEGGYEQHASGCGICGREADDIEEMMATGSTAPDQIRAQIDLNYSSYGRPTNTP